MQIVKPQLAQAGFFSAALLSAVEPLVLLPPMASDDDVAAAALVDDGCLVLTNWELDTAIALSELRFSP